MKKILPFLFAIAAMGIAMFVVATLLDIDIKAEIEHRLSGEIGEGSLPEVPEA